MSSSQSKSYTNQGTDFILCNPGEKLHCTLDYTAADPKFKCISPKIFF